MSECVFRDNTIIKDYGRPYFVAEVNSSHNGDIEKAKEMIDAAEKIGCDCVKFQSWSLNSLYSMTYYEQNPMAKRFVDKFSLSSEQLKKLAVYCKNKGIGFASTPYSEEEVDFLVDECLVPYIKIASMELNNYSFLRYIGAKQIPIVLSTGMSELDEIRKAVHVLEDAGATQMVILHCVSIYPTIISTVNLNNIFGLREEFPQYPIGFSDHTEGDAASIAATALGVALIEKHLTLDHKKVGMDNGMATEPEAFKILVDKCHDTQIGMGSKQRIVLPQEYEQRKKMRRSIIVTRDLCAGEVLQRKDLYAKRPGTGIGPEHIDEIVGQTIKRDIKADTLIMPQDLD
jgi:N-acetylneuraminate synthase